MPGQLSKRGSLLAGTASVAALLRFIQLLLRRKSALSAANNPNADLPFSAFLSDLRAGLLVEVLFGPNDLIVTTKGTATANGPPARKYRTQPVAMDRTKVVEELVAKGVRFAAQQTSAWERSTKALVFAAPFVYLGCVACIVHRMQHPRDSVGSQIGGRHSNSSTSQVAKWVQQWFQPVLRLLPGQSSNNRLEDSPASRDGQDDENDDDDNNDDNEEGGDSIEGSTTKRRINGPTFADVAGTEAAKQELAELVSFLRSPQRFYAMGCRLPRGVLLSGPPGTGKTLLARALANEAGVPFFFASASEFVEMLVGRGAARMRDLFARARAVAPSIVFIDEIDSLGKARGGFQSNDEREQTLNQILTEMDGFADGSADGLGADGSLRTDGSADHGSGGGGAARGGTKGAKSVQSNSVLVVAATNRPEVLDPALLRPGRFDRHVRLPLPDQAGRLAILKVHARKVALARGRNAAAGLGGGDEPGQGQGEGQGGGQEDGDDGENESVDLVQAAALTSGLSGAELANVVNEAALFAVRDRGEAVTNAHFEAAIAKQMTYQCSASGAPTGSSSSRGFNIEDLGDFEHMFLRHDNGLGSVD